MSTRTRQGRLRSSVLGLSALVRAAGGAEQAAARLDAAAIAVAAGDLDKAELELGFGFAIADAAVQLAMSCCAPEMDDCAALLAAARDRHLAVGHKAGTLYGCQECERYCWHPEGAGDGWCVATGHESTRPEPVFTLALARSADGWLRAIDALHRAAERDLGLGDGELAETLADLAAGLQAAFYMRPGG